MEALVDPTFWRGKRVFLTGHTGFKGGWLALWLHRLEAQVYGYSLPAQADPSFFSAASIDQRTSTTIGDIRDLPALIAAVRSAEPEIFFHLAAQPLVRSSYQDPVGTYASNIMGSVHALEAIRACPSVRAAVFVTSDKCYRNQEWDWGYRETDPMGGHDPYSSSKACVELVVSAYRSSYFSSGSGRNDGVAVASARAGNVIGGGDWAQDRLVPDFIRAATAGIELKIRSPTSVRPWQHVLEPLAGYLMLAKRLYTEGTAFAESWNFGPHEHDSRSVGWLVQKLGDLWGAGTRWSIENQGNLHEAHRLKLEISKTRARLQWEPRLSIEEALARTVEWYTAYRDGKDMYEASIAQIEAYNNRDY